MSRLFRARRVLEGELSGFAQRDYGIKRAAGRRPAGAPPTWPDDVTGATRRPD